MYNNFMEKKFFLNVLHNFRKDYAQGVALLVLPQMKSMKFQ